MNESLMRGSIAVGPTYNEVVINNDFLESLPDSDDCFDSNLSVFESSPVLQESEEEINLESLLEDNRNELLSSTFSVSSDFDYNYLYHIEQFLEFNTVLFLAVLLCFIFSKVFNWLKWFFK